MKIKKDKAILKLLFFLCWLLCITALPMLSLPTFPFSSSLDAKINFYIYFSLVSGITFILGVLGAYLLLKIFSINEDNQNKIDGIVAQYSVIIILPLVFVLCLYCYMRVFNDTSVIRLIVKLLDKI